MSIEETIVKLPVLLYTKEAAVWHGCKAALDKAAQIETERNIQ